MNDLHYLNISELAGLLETRKLSSVEVTQAQLDRISSLDKDLHAYSLVTEDQALKEARKADEAIARGRYLGPLHGIPIAVKDLFYTRDVPTKAGTAVLENFVPDFDATVVTKLRNAGAILLGKLNLAEGAMAAYNPKFSAPYNPWKRSIAPGGSSSGSGVATAAGMCFGSLGTDTGGSIRFPASMCGVVGVKPTWGRVSRHGVFDLAPSMDHVGTLTRSVRDGAIMLDAIAGYDASDATTLPSPMSRLEQHCEFGVTEVRIGYAERYATDDVDSETAHAVETALASLVTCGATIVDCEIPNLDKYVLAWRVLCTVEAYVAHQRFFLARSAEYGPWFRSWLEFGATCNASDYANANLLRLKCNAVIARAFAKIDVLLCPAMARPEQRKTDAQNFTEPMGEFNTKRQRFTIPYNFNGAPTITVPLGLNSRGAPISVQCVGKPGQEEFVFRVARAIEVSLGDLDRHPLL
jgi:amidase